MKKSIPDDHIGMLDWGIGGLSVYKEFKKKYKSLSFLYLSDSGFTPYGKLPKRKLLQRLNTIASFYRQKQIYTVIIACNAASTVIPELQKLNKDMNFFGMLEAGKNSLLQSRKKKLLVLGGKRTIQSGYFQKQFLNSKYKVKAIVAQPLSALIEKGLHNSKEFEVAVDALVKQTPFLPDVVLLACTHYPAATDVFKAKFATSQILDPAEFLVKDFGTTRIESLKKKSIFFTTGSAFKSQSAAKKAFDLGNIVFKKLKF